MGHYFSLQQFGAGSLEVESLGCYFFRLAQAHDCSRWQLGRHLRAWSDANGAGVPWRYFPSGMLDKAMTMCGYGSAVSRIVESLQLATGVPTLRSGTLLSLENVAARNAPKTLRTRRAWCPACYSEDINAQNEAYDRLLWSVVPIKRCAIHKVELRTQCPKCNSPQDYSRDLRQLTRCIYCKGSLMGDQCHMTVSPNPYFGEKQIHELISACAKNPGLTLQSDSIAEFFRRARLELSPNHPLRARSSSFSRYGSRATLESLLQLATTFNVSLLDFQASGQLAPNLPLYGPDCVPVGPGRPRQTRAAVLQVEAALKKLLENEKPLPPLRDFCEELGVSKGFVNYRFPELTKIYLSRRRLARESAKEAALAAAIRLVEKAGLWRDYHCGGVRQKFIEREIVRMACVSVPIARKALLHFKCR